MSTIVPPSEVFEKPIREDSSAPASGGYDIPGFIDVIQSPEGEMLARYALLETEGVVITHPYPRKGLSYKEGVQANNQVKRITLALFAPFASISKGFIPFLQAWLNNFNRLCWGIYGECKRVPVLKYEYYNTTSKGLWTLARVFLTAIGIEQDIADTTGKMLATIFEYDDAYRMPLVDAFSCFSKSEIIKSPGRFVKRFIEIIQQRSIDNPEIIKKFASFGFLLRLLLLLPKYRRAFRKAFNEVDLRLLQYDSIDYYWSLNKAGYNFQGRSLDDRFLEFQKQIAHHLNIQTGKAVQIIDNGDYTCNFNLYDNTEE